MIIDDLDQVLITGFLLLSRFFWTFPDFLDFSDFPGFDYHSGLVFSVHVFGFGFSIAKGGEYVSKQNNIVREAIGFDINVSSLTKLNQKI